MQAAAVALVTAVLPLVVLAAVVLEVVTPHQQRQLLELRIAVAAVVAQEMVQTERLAAQA
jgi:hypothetical protein